MVGAIFFSTSGLGHLFFFNCALLAVLLDAMTRMLISDTGSRYMPKFLRKRIRMVYQLTGIY